MLNDRLDADFDPDDFEHVAFFDRERSWIEMRLRARRAVRVRVPRRGRHPRPARRAARSTPRSPARPPGPRFEAALASTGLALERWFTDAEGWFAIALLRARAAAGTHEHDWERVAPGGLADYGPLSLRREVFEFRARDLLARRLARQGRGAGELSLAALLARTAGQDLVLATAVEDGSAEARAALETRFLAPPRGAAAGPATRR